MPSFVTDDGVRLAYEVAGDGPPIVLVHGFASSVHTNWRRPGWFTALTGAARRVVALDCRGHGGSDKPQSERAENFEYGSRLVDLQYVIFGYGAAEDFLGSSTVGGTLAGFGASLGSGVLYAGAEGVYRFMSAVQGDNPFSYVPGYQPNRDGFDLGVEIRTVYGSLQDFIDVGC